MSIARAAAHRESGCLRFGGPEVASQPPISPAVSSDLARPVVSAFPLGQRIYNWEMPDNGLTVVDSSAVPWEERPNEKIGRSLYRKNLIVDPDTGMEVRLVRYPAGAINPRHTHPCGHGMYVLDGTLVTHDGQYGPGHFVWFPEGSVMEHGATAEQDVTVLFITNKRFEIDYQ
jgi:quercetin dioxygenase-like cupin family protein